MFQDQDINRHNYQLRFMEMENKIKRCELERAELEQRFAQLMRERQECEKIAARQLKQKYKRMMELERQRAERNESLLRMLHNIDQQAASIAAKTDRLKMLKTQYESYLIRSWSSQRALPSPSPVPSLNTQQFPSYMAPHHTPSYQVPSRLTDSPKSEFVRYLSDMTHAQTVTYNPIPPPIALSNYIHHQQLPIQQHLVSPYSAPTPSFTQDPFIRSLGDNSSLQSSIINPSSIPKMPTTPSRSLSTVPPAKKLDLSNEEFIQYIDNEILKGSSTSEPATTDNDQPPDIVIEPPSITSTPLPDAYLEDLTNDEDEYLRLPGLTHSIDDLPVIEEIVESTANLDLNDGDAMLTALKGLEKPLAVPDDAVINQRWEKIVEVNSIVRPPVEVAPEMDPSQDTVEVPSMKTPLEEVVAQTLRGVISEVEDQYEAPVVSDASAVNEPQLSSDQANELADTSAAFGEMQNEYQQPFYESEAEYHQESYLPNTSQGYQEGAPPVYSSQDPEEYNDYLASDTQQVQQATAEDPTRWTMTKNTVRSKSYSTSQSRTPETIDEVVSNGEENPLEQHDTTLGSKHSSPVGQIASTTEVHYPEPETQPEQPLLEEVDQQYDYSQYPQEYDPNDPNQQAAYYQQYTDGQTGVDQTQAYQQGYAEQDPNQFQQATEYPGPTQYVFEQGYYEEQQPQQVAAELDQNQEYYEGDPNATDQQQYYTEGQVDQTYYDQSQAEVEYANYDEQVATVAADVAPQEEVLESVAEEEEEKQMTLDHPTEMVDTVQNIEEKTSSGSEVVAAEENSDSPVKPNASGKEDTTISSVNDEIAVKMIYIKALFVLVSFLLNTTVTTAISYRLPDSTYPSHYIVRIETNSDLGSADNYTGQVTITLNVYYPTDQIVLHAADNLDILELQLQQLESGEIIEVQSTELVNETQFLKIYTDRVLNETEQYQLRISFQGRMLRERVGFFLEAYQNGAEKEFYAVTAFEPIHARRAFPCYDKPMFKSTFDVEIECGKDYSVHSNAQAMETQMVGKDRKLVRFERTPPMASYLVAFMISKFREEVRDFGGLKIGMITQPDGVRSRNFEFAFQATWFSIDALQRYTGEKYPFAKLDQVGIDYFYGGLENWGLILYITDALVVDSQADTWDKVDSAKLIAHEVAHQFFGNLVGLTWWEHLWLKEGFATFMSYKLTELFLPGARQVIKQQYFMDRWEALHFDADSITYPMSNYVEHPRAIAMHYGAEIVYNKAACVIRMMEVALGEGIFMAGVQDYIANDRYGTADPYKLYLSLHEFAVLPPNVHIAEIFHSWANQAGHPIVYVEKIGEFGWYRLTQQMYCDAETCKGSRWWIPIFYSSYELGDYFGGWFPDSAETITVALYGNLPLVNNRGYAFYRVSYCQRGWQDIIINWNDIDSESRAMLIDDAFYFLWNNGSTIEPLKAMLDLLKTESDPLPWLAAMDDRTMSKLLLMVKGRSEVEPFVQQMARNLTLDMLKIFRNDTRIESSLARRKAIDWEERMNLTTTRRVGKSKQGSHMCPQMLSPELMAELRCNVKFLIEMLRSVDLTVCFNGPDEFRQFLDYLLQSYECPEVLEVILVVLREGVSHVDQLIDKLANDLYDLQNSIESDQLEEFLKGVTYYVYDPLHQRLYWQFVDRLEGISEEQRSAVFRMLDSQKNRVARVVQVLLEYQNFFSV
ncbi:hypothetical protein RP20_CCG009227 [Aedes albopictus]|nr:hypothetical protein RP20_CCG009227 [Aedes albopictus]